MMDSCFYDHMCDGMKDLHQLKIPQCIQFKILVTIYQCVNGVAPSFVINLLDLILTRKNVLHKAATTQTDNLDYHPCNTSPAVHRVPSL